MQPHMLLALFCLQLQGSLAAKKDSGNSSGALITMDEFVEAVTKGNEKEAYPKPSKDKYTSLISQAKEKGGIDSKRELAMFLTHVIWETGGLQHAEEITCAKTGCPGAYPNKDPSNSKSYYGRGYLQLTWDYNYEAASKALYNDKSLVESPEKVSKDDKIAWATALWFWKSKIHGNKEVQKGHFGASTNIINGALECTAPGNIKAETRFKIYSKILKIFSIDEKPNKEGCKR